jgi:hypothetical protein
MRTSSSARRSWKACRSRSSSETKIWFEGDRRERVLSFLREHRLVHVVVDEPQGFASSIPSVWGVTSLQLAIVRFHGRNGETWEKKGLASGRAVQLSVLQSRTSRSSRAPQRALGERGRDARVIQQLLPGLWSAERDRFPASTVVRLNGYLKVAATSWRRFLGAHLK